MNHLVSDSHFVLDTQFLYFVRSSLCHRRRILHISDGIDNPGGLVGQLTLSLFIVWFLVYLCIWRGIGWMGKVLYYILS